MNIVPEPQHTWKRPVLPADANVDQMLEILQSKKYEEVEVGPQALYAEVRGYVDDIKNAKIRDALDSLAAVFEVLRPTVFRYPTNRQALRKAAHTAIMERPAQGERDELYKLYTYYIKKEAE